MRKVLFCLLLLSATFAVKAQYRDVKLPDSSKHTNYKDYSSIDKGFWCAVDLEGGSSVMVNSTNMQYTNVAFTGGYRFSEFLRVGVGLGVRYYVNNGEVRDTDNDFGIPLFANIRGNFISAYDRDGVPFWSLNVGGITNDGFFASPTVGYSFGGRRNNFQIGLSYTIVSFRKYTGTDVAYSYLGMKLGYEF